MTYSKPPEGMAPMGELLWELRNFGYPITKQSVDYVLEYLEKLDASPDEVSAEVVAQWVGQSKGLDFETDNELSGRELLEKHGIDTQTMSQRGVQLALEDFHNYETNW